MLADKESSDEFNPPVAIAGPEGVRPRQVRTLGDYFALAIATCGVGYMPLAPGTWGSAVGVGIYLVLRVAFAHSVVFASGPGLLTADRNHLLFTLLLLAVIFLVTGIGTWAATRAEALFGRKDPSAVVVDEVSGQLTTFLFLPLIAPTWTIVAGFLLFRAFDIVKPYPIRKLESLGAGLGIMADDVLAGLYAAVLLLLLVLMSSVV